MISKSKNLLLLFIICMMTLVGCNKITTKKDQNTNTEKETTTKHKKTSNAKDQLTIGKKIYKGFKMDNVLHSKSLGDIHYHSYVPRSYDGSTPYALYVTLPGYEGLYFQGVGENLRTENFAFEAQKYNDKMIIIAPQLDDWGETSANKTIELVRFLMNYYNIDKSRVYANGYSGGGETMSLVLEKAPELFTAYLQCSSKWDGDDSGVIKNKLPIYFVIGENDEYYGSEPTRQIYEKMYQQYKKQGLKKSQIDELLVLDVKKHKYFTKGGISVEHGGGILFAQDKNIMGWLFSKKKLKR